MGLFDALKGLVPRDEPMPWDAQTIRHPLFTLRLPEGWRFTEVDWRRAAAIGPNSQAVELYYSIDPQPSPVTAENVERIRAKTLELMRMLVKHDAQFKTAPTQSTLPDGVLWTEAVESRGDAQWLVVYVVNLQPKAAQYQARSPKICLRTSVPAASGALGAQRLETLRSALRNVQWN